MNTESDSNNRPDTVPAITAIIPTLCDIDWRKRLRRAIHSLTTQENVSLKILVVVNGDRCSSELLDEIESIPGVSIHHLSEANVAAARRFGRELVDTEFFCFLDDDDVYLPGALEIKSAQFRTDEALDVIVSNGIRDASGCDILVCHDMRAVMLNPMRSLIYFNWLNACAGLFRTSSIPAEYFDSELKHFEWTYLAFKLALTKRIAYIDEATYKIFDSPNSVSKSEAYQRAEPEVLRKIISLPLSRDIRRQLRSKHADSLHSLSDLYRNQGRMRLAWYYHLKCLCQVAGIFRYLTYTRKLFRAGSQ